MADNTNINNSPQSHRKMENKKNSDKSEKTFTLALAN